MSVKKCIPFAVEDMHSSRHSPDSASLHPGYDTSPAKRGKVPKKRSPGEAQRNPRWQHAIPVLRTSVKKCIPSRAEDMSSSRHAPDSASLHPGYDAFPSLRSGGRCRLQAPERLRTAELARRASARTARVRRMGAIVLEIQRLPTSQSLQQLALLLQLRPRRVVKRVLADQTTRTVFDGDELHAHRRYR